MPAIESAVERAFQQDAGPMLECMDEETKKDTRRHLLLKAYYSVIKLAINDKTSWTFLPDISIDSFTDETLRNNASMLTQRVQPCHVPLIETAIKNEMKAALDSIKPEVFAKLNNEAIQHMKSQWQIKH